MTASAGEYPVTLVPDTTALVTALQILASTLEGITNELRAAIVDLNRLDSGRQACDPEDLPRDKAKTEGAGR